jgi:hypothetical protein
MRLAHDADRLYLLAATRHFIYNKPFFFMDDEWYFMLDGKQSEKLAICQASFPKESPLSLQIQQRSVWRSILRVHEPSRPSRILTFLSPFIPTRTILISMRPIPPLTSTITS